MSFSLLRRALEKRGLGYVRSISSMSNGDWAPRLMLSPTPEDGGEAAYKLHGIAGGEDLLLEKKKELAALRDLEIVGSAHGWIALQNTRNDDVFLWNPTSGQHTELPPFHSLPDYHTCGGGRVSRFAMSDDGQRAVMVMGRARRLAFCEPGKSSRWGHMGGLYCNSSTIGLKAREYEDVIYSRRHDLFYCVTRVGMEMEGWSLRQMKAEMEWQLPRCDELELDNPYYDGWPSNSLQKEKSWHLKYVVFAEERGELFLVIRHVNPRVIYYGSNFDWVKEAVYYSKYRGCEYSYPYKTIDFDVFKIHVDEREGGGGRVEYMKELDGLSMVVGMNQTYAVEVEGSSSSSSSNLVYFSDERRMMRLSQSDVHNVFGGHDNGIFDYKNKTFSTCACGSDDCPLKQMGFKNYHNSMRIDPPPLWFALPSIS